MKKLLFILAAVLLLCACEKSSGDILKGTWRSDMGINSSTSGATDLKLVYNFDGEGHFSYYSENEPAKGKGTYEIKQDTLVYLHGTSTYETEVEQEYEDLFFLDRQANPLTLTKPVYTSDGILLAYCRLIKQN